MQFQELEKNDSFDVLSLYPLAQFTQADFYGDWQEKLGRKARRFIVKKDSEVIAYLQVIKYLLPFNKSCLYIPYGPVVKGGLSSELLSLLKKELLQLLKQEGSVFLRFDFAPTIKSDAEFKLLDKFFTKAARPTFYSAYFQLRASWFLNLEKSEEELISGMRHKIPYNVRLAERKSVEVELVKEDFGKIFDDFYGLLKGTAERGNFYLHPKEYYQAMFDIAEKEKNSFFAVAKYQEKPLVINFVLVFGKIATFVFGGSSDEHRNLMPAYLLQWKTIQEVKRLGLQYYSFGGIATEDDAHKDWGGFSFFKKRFGGEEFRHSDPYDLVAKPFWYQLYKLKKRFK